MFREFRMMLILLVLATSIDTSLAKTVKKYSKDESTFKNNNSEEKLNSINKISRPAIIAIEIVDPNENKTAKNSKRTIDSSLGYGYHNSFGATNKPARLEYYKYSQRDIPPYRSQANAYSSGNQGQVYDIQKSITYNLGTQTTRSRVPVYKTAYPKVPVQDLTQYYQPGTTLYSTIDQQGQVGQLTQSPNVNQDQSAAVPVILLRVYTNQLTNPTGGLYPNLPQTHPYADNLNSIDLQSLLAKYVQNLLYQQPLYQAQPYHGQLYQPQYQLVQMPASILPTYENYPDDAHTRVIFHHRNGHLSPQGTTVVPAAKQYKTITVQLPPDHQQQYSNIEVQAQDVPQYTHAPVEEQAQSAYYYDTGNQIGDVQNYYYVPQQQEEEASTQPYEEPNDTTQAPFNYHAHANYEKSSRRNRKARGRTTSGPKAKREKRQE